MKELTILMGWYDEKDSRKRQAYEENRDSFMRHNPGIEVITVMNNFHGMESNNQKAWLCSDVPMYNWYLKNGKANNSERYLLVEWDCWCDISIKDYYSCVWNKDLVAPSVQYIERDSWCWFESIKKLPEHSRKYATGVVPFCGILLSDHAMQSICPEIIKPEYMKVISELRLGTVATMLGIYPVPNPQPSRALGWKGTSNFDLTHKGLHHPRKFL
jgi:hypothetical protein